MRNRTDILFAADQTKQSLYVLFILCHLLLLLPSWAMPPCLNKFILTHLFKQVKGFLKNKETVSFAMLLSLPLTFSRISL